MQWLWLLVIALFLGQLSRDYFGLGYWIILVVFLLLSYLAKQFNLLHESHAPAERKWWSLSLIPAFLWATYIYFVGVFGSFDLGAIVFHYQAGLAGQGEAKAVYKAAFYLGGILFFSIAIAWLGNRDIRVRRHERRAAVFFLLVNPMWLSVHGYAFGLNEGDRERLLEQYVETDAVLKQDPKNLLLIYVESVEKTFSNPVFGDAYHEFSLFAEQGSEIGEIFQVENTRWTVAGMVASQCGVPLMPLGLFRGNNYRSLEYFLPDAVCLGDVLKQDGYLLSYMGGAGLEFGGKGQFYKDHGFDRIFGFHELEAHVEDGYRNKWGLYDDTLFDQVLEEARHLHSQENPYALVVLTISAHFPHGLPARTCLDRLGDFDGRDILYSVRCTGFLVDKLLSKMDGEGLLENTQVVILSDHLAMKNNVWDQLNALERTNTFIVIPPLDYPGGGHRKASMVDAFPTLLEILGYELDPPHRAGIGVSLLQDAFPTLVEQYGLDDLDRYIAADTALGRRIWGLDDAR